MVRLANPIDFWRGFALVTIFVNHVPGIYYERFTHRNVSLSDSAELFVFLAGWALRLLADSFEKTGSRTQLIARLGSRALTIYAAQMLLIAIAIAMLAGAATFYDNPLLLEWHNAAAVFYDPVRAHIGLALLTHQLGYFDILPLYVVLMVLAPGIVLLHRAAPGMLLPISLAIYFVALVYRVTPSTWPTQGHWFFNPLTWQAVFVLGFALAADAGPGALVRRHLAAVRWISFPVVVVTAVVVQMSWLPDPTTVPEPKLLFLDEKSFLTPMRLLHFLALAAVASAVYPFIAAAVPPLVDFLARLGRNSLNVFCVGSILSLSAQIVRFEYQGGLVLDTAIVVVGIAALGVTGWLSESNKRVKSATAGGA